MLPDDLLLPLTAAVDGPGSSLTRWKLYGSFVPEVAQCATPVLSAVSLPDFLLTYPDIEFTASTDANMAVADAALSAVIGGIGISDNTDVQSVKCLKSESQPHMGVGIQEQQKQRHQQLPIIIVLGPS